MDLSSLIRIRDFINLLLSYSVKLEEEGILNDWINAFSEWKAQLLSTDYDGVIDKPWLVHTQKALKWTEGLIPTEIISHMKNCGAERSIFGYNDVKIPRVILRLTVDLAVQHLTQTLFPRDDQACNMRYVRLSTRNLVEKGGVVCQIAVALEDKHMFGMDQDFLRTIWIDASKYESDVEVQVQEEINGVMAGDTREEDETKNNKYLIIIVDGEGNNKLDPQRMCFPEVIVVLITTEPSTHEEEGNEFTIACKMDLNIRTRDHLLPWKVFLSYVGNNNVVHSYIFIKKIAVLIVEKCRGHLLSIVIVAKSLKNVKDVKLWELALSQLSYKNGSYNYVYEESDRIGINRVMVNAFLNIIWERIDEIQKRCLELCLFVHKIKDGVPRGLLNSHWERIYSKTDRRRIMLQGSIEKLVNRSVLLQCESGNIRLPAETYDIIKWIHASNPSFIMHGALGLTEAPYIGRWHCLVRIELMDNKICELPQSPDCPKLTVLLLQGNLDLMDIPDSFFEHMPLLQYLDLSNTSIRGLPSSIFKLTKLHKFNLRGCDLFVELPPQIGRLKKLKVLDLDGTLITHLPKETRELINLQRLILCFDYEPGHGKEDKQTIIPPGVISHLTRLNYLSINVDPDDQRWNENVGSIFVEILALKRLKRVSIYVPRAELLELIPAHKSLDFKLVVGHHMQRFISRVTPQVEKKFKDCDSGIKFVNGVNVPNGLKMNLGRFRALYLDRHMSMKSLSELELKNLHRLQVCVLAECNEMETVVDGSYSHDGLPYLGCLAVFYMKSLRNICEGPRPMVCSLLCSLKSMALHTCPKLTTIFSLSYIDNLSLLEELIVEDCPKVTTLINCDSSQLGRSCFLPKLRVISLVFLPELVNIFNGLRGGESLEKMGIYNCPKLQSLSKGELSSEYLRVIKGERRWWEALKWKEAEWGDEARPNFLDQIFSPSDEEADIMTQLAVDQHEDKDGAKLQLTFPERLPWASHLETGSPAEKSENLSIIRRSIVAAAVAEARWLKPEEVFYILQNHQDYQITLGVPQQPPSGSLFLFNRKIHRYLHRDGYHWREKNDGRTLGEAHEPIKVGNIGALCCYYAQGQQNPNFQRRTYWVVDPTRQHIALVHYRDTGKLLSKRKRSPEPRPPTISVSKESCGVQPETGLSGKEKEKVQSEEDVVQQMSDEYVDSDLEEDSEIEDIMDDSEI